MPLPVVILSGFLGAGKTTLLNGLLEHGLAGRRVGVVVNDFGTLNVDGRLLGMRGQPLIELSNGCLCCSLRQGLVDAVQQLARRNDLDLVVIEASGISILSSVLHTLDTAGLAEQVRVDRVVAVVDARRYLRALHALPAIQDQVGHANLLILNHCDKVDAGVVEATQLRLRQQNPAASIVATEHGRIEPGILLSGFTPARASGPALSHHEHWLAYEVHVPAQLAPGELLERVNRLPETVERVKGFVTAGRASVLQKTGTFPATLELLPPASVGGQANTLVVLAREPVDAVLHGIFPDHLGFAVVPPVAETHSESAHHGHAH